MAHNLPIRPTTTVGGGSVGVSLPSATIDGQSLAGPPAFPSAGVFEIYTTDGPQEVTYTGISGNTFTGCTGGTGTIQAGAVIADRWLNISTTEIQALLSQLAEAINADDGGCYAPSSPIIFSANGPNVTGPTVVARGGQLLANGTHAIVLNDNDFRELSPPRARTIQYPCMDSRSSLPGHWNCRASDSSMQAYAPALDRSDGFGANAADLSVRIRAHDGATIGAVTVHFRVAQAHAQLPPTMPSFRIIRVASDGETQSLASSAQGANSLGYVSFPKPTTADAWYANGASQSFTIECDQNNVVDVATYDYKLEVLEEAGIPGFPWVSTWVTPVRLIMLTDYGSPTGAAAGGVAGIAFHDGDRILLANQADPRQNGIWIAKSQGPWSRAPDLRKSSQFVQGFMVPVQLPSAAIGTPTWQSSTTYAVGETVVAFTPNGYFFVATAITSGTSGSSEPSWNNTAGGTTADSGVTWTCIGNVTPGAGFYVQCDPSITSWDPGTQPDVVGAWEPTSSPAFPQGTVPSPAKATGLWYIATGSGSTGSSEPAWPTGVGQTVVDGAITWVAAGKAADPLVFLVKPDQDNPLPGTGVGFVPYGNIWDMVEVSYVGIADRRFQ